MFSGLLQNDVLKGRLSLVESFFKHNRPFAASHSRGTKPPRWRAKVALGQDKQKTYIILNGNCLCLSSPSATFALQHGGFVPREWLAAKGLLLSRLVTQGLSSSFLSRPIA